MHWCPFSGKGRACLQASPALATFLSLIEAQRLRVPFSESTLLSRRRAERQVEPFEDACALVVRQFERDLARIVARGQKTLDSPRHILEQEIPCNGIGQVRTNQRLYRVFE